MDVAYPHAPVVRVVLDNLNTHRMASLYETFPAAEARRIVKRLEFHHTPKHASWLNMAEIEFSVLTRACFQGRNPDEPAQPRAIGVYETERNAKEATIDWRFTTQDTRHKLHRFYPCHSNIDRILGQASVEVFGRDGKHPVRPAGRAVFRPVD